MSDFAFLINAFLIYTCRLLPHKKWSHWIDRFGLNSRLGCGYNVHYNNSFPKPFWFCSIQKSGQWAEGYLQAFIKYWAECLKRSGVDSACCHLMQSLSSRESVAGTAEGAAECSHSRESPLSHDSLLLIFYYYFEDTDFNTVAVQLLCFGGRVFPTLPFW